MADLAAMVCAGTCCLGGWSVIGGSAGYLAHRRMQSVERELGARAEPAGEARYLWYAGASLFWLSAAVVAAVGLFSRKWTRTGRDATFILLAHFTIVTLGAIFIAPPPGTSSAESLVPIITFACIVAGGGFSVAPVFGVLWARARARRLSALEAEGPPPGFERYPIYFGSLLFWPIGLVAAAFYAKPESVRVGMTALSLSLAHIWLIAVVTCVSIPFLVARFG